MEGQIAWVTQGQASRDAMAMTEMREVRARKTILRFVPRNSCTRAFPARTHALFFLVRRFGDSDTHRLTRALPTPARLPQRSPHQQPLSGLNKAYLEVRYARYGFRDRPSSPRAASPAPFPRPPSDAPQIERARTNFPIVSDGSLLTSAVLARARGGHHPRGRVHQAGHGVRRRPAGYCRVEQGTSIKRTRADRASRARRNTAPSSETSGVRGESETDDSFAPPFSLISSPSRRLRESSLVSARS